jgi:Na+/H+ antiporter NhaD/arsenite permease-like protein
VRWVILTLFALTYAGISARRVSLLPIGRPALALVGATALVIAGHFAGAYGLSPDAALHAVEPNTIALLVAMMIVSSALGEAGFFDRATGLLAARIRTPAALLYAVTFGAGLLSAVLVNDAVCVLATPLVVRIARRVGAAARPLLFAVAMGSNAGSALTLGGNPQNMMVARLSGLTYRGYLAHAALPTLAALAATAALIHAMFRGGLAEAAPAEATVAADNAPRMLPGTLTAVAVVVIANLGGAPLAWSALAGASLALIAARERADRVLAQIEWSVPLFFAGLFISVAALRQTGLPALALGALGPTTGAHADRLLVPTLALGSQVVSNVPLILLLEPWIRTFPDADRAWTITALVSTLAGNLTLLGSVANVIVFEQAKAKVGFVEYLKVGVPVTVVSTALALGLLRLVG